MDVAKMLARKDNVVKQNNDGILYLFKKEQSVTFFHGRGSFAGKAVEGGYDQLLSRGSGKTEESMVPPSKSSLWPPARTPVPCLARRLTKSTCCPTTARCAWAPYPRSWCLIGSGVIGLEMGSVWRRLGADVTILEGLPTFLGAVDEQIAKEAKKAFDKQGLKIELGVKVGEIVKAAKKTSQSNLHQRQRRGGEALVADKLIVSIGRVPNTIGLNAEAIGLQVRRARCNRGGQLTAKPTLPGVWAVGDVVRGPMLAHKAEEEGVAVAERIAGQHGHVNFNTIPWVIYTSPEIAWVGRTEQQLKVRRRGLQSGHLSRSSQTAVHVPWATPPAW